MEIYFPPSSCIFFGHWKCSNRIWLFHFAGSGSAARDWKFSHWYSWLRRQQKLKPIYCVNRYVLKWFLSFPTMCLNYCSAPIKYAANTHSSIVCLVKPVIWLTSILLYTDLDAWIERKTHTLILFYSYYINFQLLITDKYLICKYFYYSEYHIKTNIHTYMFW